ncbi:MAG: hypothetical protein HY079_11650, partial [Elusimicrobia bacterium]|nr:hypothetical protein [Elusimicrobiota bacterium]
PGGRFLAYADDGARVWAGYEYSDHSAASLRDGVLQSWDPVSAAVSLRAVAGQREGVESVLLVDAPDPRPAFLADHDGLGVALEWSSPAQAAVVETLGGPGWREPFAAKAPKDAPGAALVFLPRPPARADRRRAAGRRALAALKVRLAAGAWAGVLLPPDAPASAVAAVLADARAAFGAARAADLASGGVLVVAGAEAPETNATVFFSRLPLAVRLSAPKGAADALGAALRWRDSPSGK